MVQEGADRPTKRLFHEVLEIPPGDVIWLLSHMTEEETQKNPGEIQEGLKRDSYQFLEPLGDACRPIEFQEEDHVPRHGLSCGPREAPLELLMGHVLEQHRDGCAGS